MIVALDFDKTFDDVRLHGLIKKMRKENNEIWIVTMRKDNEFNRNKIKPFLDKMFLSFGNVIFCDEKPKEEMLQMINADIYIDNISNEFESIMMNTNVIPLLFIK